MTLAAVQEASSFLLPNVILYRIDDARNMRRYYRLDIQLDLFGNYCVVREYGRIGCPGQVRSIPYSTDDEAQVAFQKQRATKERRGYAILKFPQPIDIPITISALISS